MNALAFTMTDARAALILTWTDEPELLAVAGQAPPTFTPEEIEAARLRSSWNGPSADDIAAAKARCHTLGLPYRAGFQ